jgi:hypothetical protein
MTDVQLITRSVDYYLYCRMRDGLTDHPKENPLILWVWIMVENHWFKGY